ACARVVPGRTRLATKAPTTWVRRYDPGGELAAAADADARTVCAGGPTPVATEARPTRIRGAPPVRQVPATAGTGAHARRGGIIALHRILQRFGVTPPDCYNSRGGT